VRSEVLAWCHSPEQHTQNKLSGYTILKWKHRYRLITWNSMSRMYCCLWGNYYPTLNSTSWDMHIIVTLCMLYQLSWYFVTYKIVQCTNFRVLCCKIPAPQYWCYDWLKTNIQHQNNSCIQRLKKTAPLIKNLLVRIHSTLFLVKRLTAH
jgi:hypothetical protein